MFYQRGRGRYRPLRDTAEYTNVLRNNLVRNFSNIEAVNFRHLGTAELINYWISERTRSSKPQLFKQNLARKMLQ